MLIPIIRDDLHIPTEQYGYITGAFQMAYTIGFLFVREGSSTGSEPASGTPSPSCGGPWPRACTRCLVPRSSSACGAGLLGFGEAGNFPSAIKAVAEWFPKKDRAFATGIFNAGTNVASMVGPPLFVWMAMRYGWRDLFPDHRLCGVRARRDLGGGCTVCRRCTGR